MGIAITVYLNLVEVNPVHSAYDEDSELNDDKYVEFYDNPDFPGRISPFKGRPVVYEYSKSSDISISMPYSTYNAWREQLAMIAGYTPVLCPDRNRLRHDAAVWAAGSGPFYELINFSDCEGTIGTDVAKKLVGDFVKYRSVAEHYMSPLELNKYDNLCSMCEYAVKYNGALKFH